MRYQRFEVFDSSLQEVANLRSDAPLWLAPYEQCAGKIRPAIPARPAYRG